MAGSRSNSRVQPAPNTREVQERVDPETGGLTDDLLVSDALINPLTRSQRGEISLRTSQLGISHLEDVEEDEEWAAGAEDEGWDAETVLIPGGNVTLTDTAAMIKLDRKERRSAVGAARTTGAV